MNERYALDFGTCSCDTLLSAAAGDEDTGTEDLGSCLALIACKGEVDSYRPAVLDFLLDHSIHAIDDNLCSTHPLKCSC